MTIKVFPQAPQYSMAIAKTVLTLRNMTIEMFRKGLDCKRISLSGYSLIESGLTPNSLPNDVIQKIQASQFPDGGWSGIVDTMWNWAFLKLSNRNTCDNDKIKTFLLNQISNDGLWGRSQRDHGRIPVTGMMLFLHPEIGSTSLLEKLEHLWLSEKNSLTYKAAYSLMAFARHETYFKTPGLQQEIADWLASQQRPDGGFAPWLSHPASSNVFWTSVATMGLLACNSAKVNQNLEAAGHFIISTQLPSGIWPYHEIEEGCAWGLLALSALRNKLKL